MKSSKHVIISAAAVLLALALGGTTASAQQGSSSADKKVKQTEHGKATQHAVHGTEKSGMKEMMDNPHHDLAMAYRDNLATFARVLRGQANRAKGVDLALARPAVAEMRRSFDQLRQHYAAAMSSLSTTAATSTPPEVQHMETHLTALGVHLTALEAEVGRATPDAAQVSEHATEIVKECGGMSGKGGGKPQ